MVAKGIMLAGVAKGARTRHVGIADRLDLMHAKLLGEIVKLIEEIRHELPTMGFEPTTRERAERSGWVRGEGSWSPGSG